MMKIMTMNFQKNLSHGMIYQKEIFLIIQVLNSEKYFFYFINKFY